MRPAERACDAAGARATELFNRYGDSQTVKQRRSLTELKPLPFGRVTRVVFGMATLALIWVIGVETLSIWGALGMGFLGVSFLVGGLIGNPGCELTSLWNLAAPKGKRAHCL